jgi:predicted DNA-binding protein (MmcQ/YjbR family)
LSFPPGAYTGGVSHLERLKSFGLGLDGAWEDHPWGPESTVLKTAAGKMFVVCSEDEAGTVSATVKLTPDEGGAALSLPFVGVAKYVGRYGWVTAHVSNEPELDITLGWVRRSHEIVNGRGSHGRPGH